MARVQWKQDAVVSVGLKSGRHLLAQMLKSPYLAFFNTLSDDREWHDARLQGAEPLFCCAVTRGWLKHSDLQKVKVDPAENYRPPQLWISTFPGARKIKLWAGTSRQREFIVLGERPGGRLIRKDPLRGGVQERTVVQESIPLDDDATIDSYEIGAVWTFPLLNERLHLCDVMGRIVCPLKDVHFERNMRPEYETFVDILASRGSLEDWGYEGGS